MKTRMWRALAFGITFVLFFCVSLIAWIQWQGRMRTFTALDAITPAPVAIVLGASVKQDGTASDALRDRVQTGVELYQKGKVSRLLMTGDDGKFHINEVAAMRRLAQEAGVPTEAILTDGHGYRTYESCKRASQIFAIQKAIIVTQRFHISRALYLCTHLGIEVQGMVADHQTYERIVLFTIRDLASTLKAWWDINIFSPQPPISYLK